MCQAYKNFAQFNINFENQWTFKNAFFDFNKILWATSKQTTSAESPLNANIDGTSGDDTLIGTAGDDVINGFAGNDYIVDFGGNDTLNGGDDDDEIYGYNGNNRLNGDAGDDFLHGGDGIDIFDGGTGSDTIALGSGNTGSLISAVNVDMRTGQIFDDGIGNAETLVNVENLSGGTYLADIFMVTILITQYPNSLAVRIICMGMVEMTS